jgi:hypothetical protein
MPQPPPHIAQAAKIVQGWLDEPTIKPAAEIAKMTPAQKLDYSRSFDQKSMPAWKDPRS